MKDFREYVQQKEELLCESVKSKILDYILKSFIFTVLFSAAIAGWDTYHSHKAESAVTTAIKERLYQGSNVTIPDLINTGEQVINKIETESEPDELYKNGYDYSKGDISDKAGNIAGSCFKNFMSKYATRFKLANDLYMYFHGAPNTKTEDVLKKAKEIENDLATKKTFKELVSKMKTQEGRKELKDAAKDKVKTLKDKGAQKLHDKFDKD